MTDKDQALLMVLMAAQGTDHPGTRYHRDQCVRLAMQWPSLAAALADLLAAHDYGIPQSFRSARAVLRSEPPETMAVAGTGSCAHCGHVQHQHAERGCHLCSKCPGFVAPRAAQPLKSGEWCFCLMGPDADGRGHLKGEAGCDDDT